MADFLAIARVKAERFGPLGVINLRTRGMLPRASVESFPSKFNQLVVQRRGNA